MGSNTPLRILSLDGGGVRGISSLYILKGLMSQVRRQHNTGGLIALMLGRLKLDVNETITQYEQMSKEIFTVYSKEPNAMFDHVVLEKCIKKAITSSSMKLDPDCELEDENMPKTFVVSTYLDGTGTTAVRMRAFGTLTDDPFEAKVWEAARATSAAPTFFQPMVIDGIRYGDGGTGWNNPTEEAIDEAHIIWPKRPIGCLISIGTGLEDPLQLRDQSGKVSDSFLRSLFRTAAPKQDFKLRVAEFCVQCLTSCEKVHEKIDSNPTRYGLDSSYYRLNVPQGMSKIGLEEWDKLSEMKSLTKSYMDSGYIRRTKQTISKLLLNPQSAGKAREKDRQGRTTLHRAALRGDVQEIETQWDQGADIDALEDQKGWTPLICSIEQNHPEAFKTLLAIGADPNKPDSIPWTPLHHSLSGPKDPIFAWTLINEPRIEVDKRDNAGRTPLFHAVVGGQAAFISLLVSKGADVNARDNEGRIALHFASLLQNLEVLEELLKSRTDINIKDNYGRTPLHWATMRNDPTTVAWLLQKGADPQLQDLENQTPLQYAEKNNITACIPLLQAPNGRPSESQNPDTLAQLVQGLQISSGLAEAEPSATGALENFITAHSTVSAEDKVRMDNLVASALQSELDEIFARDVEEAIARARERSAGADTKGKSVAK